MVRAMSQTAFGGRRLGEGADVLEAMVRDPDCYRVLTISGAMTIAKQGLVLDEAYASAPVCTPTRTSFITGCSPARTGITYWTKDAGRDTSAGHPLLAAPPWRLDGLQPGDTTLPGLLSGAVILERQDGTGAPSDRGVLATCLHSDGAHNRILHVSGGPSETQSTGVLKMEGKDVFRHAVGMITDVIVDAYNATGLDSDDLDWFVPHQANKRIIDASAKKLVFVKPYF